jgi:putative hydrolase of the HAD superfamily
MDIKVDQNTAVVFDLDDTLYNELDYLKSAFKEIARRLSPHKWKQLYVFMFSLHRSKKNVFQIISENHQIEIRTLIDWYRSHQPEIHLFNGVFELLTQIKQKGGKLAVISDGRVNSQMAKLKSLGIRQFFDEIVISEALGTEKPDLNNFKIIEKRIKRKSYYYIADNFKKDFITPNLLGWYTIGLVDNGLNIHCNHHEFFDDAEYLPQHMILSIKELRIL